MNEHDSRLAQRVRDVIVVATEDIDAMRVTVEDSIAYIEGTVESGEQRRTIEGTVLQIDGIDRVITCLSEEHVIPSAHSLDPQWIVPPPIAMHYYSLS